MHCFDTFEGFDARDLHLDRHDAPGWLHVGHFGDTSLEAARRYISDRWNTRLKLHKGFFPDTFAGLEQHRWRFVHLDADLYAPTLTALERFYPRLVPGGVLLIHDYRNRVYYEGAAKAVRAYFRPLGIHPVPMPDKAGSAVIIRSGPG